jgi:hypothetical protein
VKQINGSVFGSMAKLEDRLGKFDSVANDMANKWHAANKRSDGLAKEVEAARSQAEAARSQAEAARSQTEGAKNQVEAKLELKASGAELERLTTQGRRRDPF